MATNQQKTAKETNKVVNYGLNHYCSLAGINKEGQIYIVDKINDHDKRNTTKRQKTMRGQVGALVANIKAQEQIIKQRKESIKCKMANAAPSATNIGFTGMQVQELINIYASQEQLKSLKFVEKTCASIVKDTIKIQEAEQRKNDFKAELNSVRGTYTNQNSDINVNMPNNIETAEQICDRLGFHFDIDAIINDTNNSN